MNLGYGRRRPDAAAGDAGRRGGRAARGRRRQRAGAAAGGQAIDIELAPDGQTVQGLVGAGRRAARSARRRARRAGAADPVALARRRRRARRRPACGSARFVGRGRVPRNGAGGEGQRRPSSASSGRRRSRPSCSPGLGTIDRRDLHRGRARQGRRPDGAGADDGLRRREGAIALSSPAGADRLRAGQRRAGQHRGAARSTGRSTARAWSPTTNVKSVLKPRRPSAGRDRQAVKRPVDADRRPAGQRHRGAP